MYHWVEDKDFLKRAYSDCAGLVNQLVQEAKKYDIDSSMKVVGSMGRNMVTQNASEPIDFDFNLLVRNAEDFKSGKELKESIRKAFNTVLKRNGKPDCEDSKSALTTKKMRFLQGNKTAFSIDVCIVKQNAFGFHRLIHEKTGMVYWDEWRWNLAPNTQKLFEKEIELKANPKNWNAVRKAYIEKKNMYLQRGDHDHPSFICYIEAVNEVYAALNTQEVKISNQISAYRV